MFLLKKFRNLSKVNQKEWNELIESEKNSNKERAIISYLKWNLENGALVDLPIYSSPSVQDDLTKKILEICQKWKSSESDEDNIK